MSIWRRVIKKLQDDIVISIGNPVTYENNWSFTSSRFRIISLIALILLLVSLIFAAFLFLGPTKSWFTNNDVSIDRQALEAQQMRVRQLEAEMNGQNKWIENVQLVLLGKIAVDSVLNKPKGFSSTELTNIENKTTSDERRLAKKVKDDMRTVVKKETESIKNSLFEAPVRGVISQEFDESKHPGVDIVCRKEGTIKACLDAVVVYSGYSRADGNFLILDHGNRYLSIYKHNKVNLKKAGQYVQLGDPIAIAGNSGENSTGPHLHFELWFEQQPIDPQTVMQF